MPQSIDTATLKAWLDRGEAFDLVDTLPAEVFERAHIPGAINIRSDDIETEAPRRLPDPDRPVVVYCTNEHCQRSVKAAERLERLGYRDVRDYLEGRRDWEDEGLPVESGQEPA